jgi:hypothetical protein
MNENLKVKYVNKISVEEKGSVRECYTANNET